MTEMDGTANGAADRPAAEVAAGEVSAAELAAVLGTATTPLLLDVREPDEFAAWAIPGARNLPLSQLEAGFERQVASVPRTAPVVVV